MEEIFIDLPGPTKRANTISQSDIDSIILSRDHHRAKVLGFLENPPAGLPEGVVMLLKISDLPGPIYLVATEYWASGDALPELGEEIALYGTFRRLEGSAEGFYLLLRDSELTNAMIRHPEIFVSATNIAQVSMCPRKLALETRFFSTGRLDEKEALLGTLRHRLFERVLTEEPETPLNVDEACEAEVLNLTEFFICREAEELEKLLTEAKNAIREARRFRQRYLDDELPIDGPAGKTIIIARVSRSEAGLCSPKLSLKGIADLLVQCRVYGRAEAPLFAEKLLPFELKTGKKRDEHQMQIKVYSLCLADGFPMTPDASSSLRNGEAGLISELSPAYLDSYPSSIASNPVPAILHYFGGDCPSAHGINPREFGQIMRRRNSIAAAMCAPALPPPLPRSRAFFCGRYCSMNKNCAFDLLRERHKLGKSNDIEALKAEDLITFSDIEDMAKSERASPEFFAYAEEAFAAIEAERKREELSDVGTGKERSFVFSNLFPVIFAAQKGLPSPLAAFDVFLKPGELPVDSPFFDYFSLGKTVNFRHGLRTDLSVEGKIVQRHSLDALGFSIFKVYIEAPAKAVEKLFEAFRSEKGFFLRFHGEWKLGGKVGREFQAMQTHVGHLLAAGETPKLARLITGFGERKNADQRGFEGKVSKLSAFDSTQCDTKATKSNDLFISSNALKSPEGFLASLSTAPSLSLTGPEHFLSTLSEESSYLSSAALQFALTGPQRKAVRASLECEHFHLVEGLSGCGKNHTLAALAFALLLSKTRTLLLAPCRKSLAAVLKKLSLRITPEQRKMVLRLAPDPLASDFDTFDRRKPRSFATHSALTSCHLFAGSLPEIADLAFRSLDFDFVLMAESGSVFEPRALSALSLGRRFVLFGDPRGSNLPPSIFANLRARFPLATTQLSVQFRMNAEIMALNNSLVYDNRLSAATQETALQQLKLVYREDLQVPLWSKELLFKSKGVVLVDYRPRDPEQRPRDFPSGVEGSKSWGGELAALEVARQFLSHGLESQELLLVTCHTRQKDFLNSQPLPCGTVLNLDELQGQESLATVLVLAARPSVEYRKWLGMGLTRAKAKLVIVGDTAQLREVEELRDLLGFLKDRRQVITLGL